jgi:hypothetical protein
MAGATLGAFHDGSVTERAGLIWDGADQSVVLAPTVKMEITGVSVNGSNLEVTWTAKNPLNGGAAYDPCNSDYAKGPVFFGKTGSSEGCTNTAAGCGSNMSFIRSYAQADDWVNDKLTGSSLPGQPAGSTALNATNTTCDANGVAKTVMPVQATTATKGILALQGKPQVKFAPSNTIIWVRAVTPTREFLVADGALPATPRRQIVDVDKCNACHLGTLYQHGGSRVDSIELCVMCHNPASTEQNRRVDIGIDATDAYDGLAGQTYDLRYMVHAIHAAGAEYGASPGYDPTTREQIRGALLDAGQPLMYYRTNGIYFFGSAPALEKITTWPADDDCVTCYDEEDGWLTSCKVYGSKATGTVPAVGADGVSCKTEGLANSTDGTWRPHRVIEVHYPRALNDCAACHVSSDPGLPDPTQAVGVTYDGGAAPWNNLVDDALLGPATASCMSCHGSGDAVEQFSLRKHAYDFSWEPAVFPNGRQTLLDAVP